MLDAIDFGLLLWLVIAAMSGVGELLSGTMLLLPFAVGALVAAGLVAVGVDMVWALVVFASISVATLLLVRRFALSPTNEPSTVRAGGSRYAGAIGVATSNIVPSGGGRVRIETESWRALTDSDKEIPVGAKVRVVQVRGNALIVEPSDAPATQSTGES
jgi:membrane protein implicated in regulation of membrane protease activity